MARPRKWTDDRERRVAQSDRRRAERAAHEVEFIGVDGEGTGRWRDHRYVMLGIGSESLTSSNGLNFTSVMDFLYTQYLESPHASFVGFFLGYDFTQWFKTLPQERARMLLTEEGRKRRQRRIHPQLGPFPVSYDGWEFDILGMKRFKVRPEHAKGWMYVCDAGPFFQASLMSVIDPRKWKDPIVTEEEYAILEEGKRERDHAVLGERMQTYNTLENRVLARLMGRVNTGLVSAGIRLKKNQWFGPGQAAQAWLTQIKAPPGDVVRTALSGDRTMRVLPQGNASSRQVSASTPLLDAGRMSYYGGWFEIFAHGHIPGNTWEYDINSAYPAIISQLPCLLHGKWDYKRGEVGRDGRRDVLTLSHAHVRGSDKRIGAMLHRRPNHNILRPHQTGGWYWQDELDAAVRAGLIDECDISESWTYHPCDCKPPMRGIAGLYDERLRVGKDSPHGKGLKLVYNSVYGKFAQSVGEPKFGNAIYASRITSGTRTMILDAIATHPEGTNAVVMVATDGIYFTSPHSNLEIGPELGTWEETTHRNLTLFKPGVYWDDNARERIQRGETASFKARGINATAFASQLSTVDNHFARWPEIYPYERDPDGPREGWYPAITFQSGFSMITCQQALQRRKWFLAGAVNDVELTQDADPITKRHSGYYENGIYWSRPFKDGGPGGIESVPYDKTFGQPDSEEYGINEDGTVKDQWAKMFR
jgi:hypothetical protein